MGGYSRSHVRHLEAMGFNTSHDEVQGRRKEEMQERGQAGVSEPSAGLSWIDIATLIERGC